jgi:hypothetical protein
MTIEEALDHLRHQESFQLVTQDLQERLDYLVRELPTVDVGLLDRHIGQITVYQEVIDTFTGV